MLANRSLNWVALVAVAVAVMDPACSTKAVGVEECRRIEYARCAAAPSCPDQFEVDDVEECRLFYRDHCLHGMPLPDAPSASNVNACADAIEQLAECAAESGSATPIAECRGNLTSLKPNKLTTACKLLASPEAITECGFLSGDATGAGGQSSGGSANGGTSDGESAGAGSLADSLGIGGLTL